MRLLGLVGLLVICPLPIPAQQGPARISPPHQSDLHLPGADDSEIVRLVTAALIARVDPKSFMLVHGHFLGDGTEAAVVAGRRQVSDGDASLTYLLSKSGRQWEVRLRDDSLDVAPCRVVTMTPQKDILLCHTDYEAGPEVADGLREIDTDLYTIDFTRNPADYTILHLRDSAQTGRRCRSAADLGSMEFENGVLRVSVKYGRSVTPSGEIPVAIPQRRYDLEFRLSDGVMLPAERSKADFEYLTANWEEDDKTCPPKK